MGILIFKYPSEKFKYSKLGIIVLILKFSSSVFSVYFIIAYWDQVQKNNNNLMMIISSIFTISLLISQFLINIFAIVFRRKFFNLFKSIEVFDLKTKNIKVNMEKYNFLNIKIFMVKVLLFGFVYRNMIISLISFLSLYAVIDLFCTVVSNLTRRVGKIEFILR
jgi:hypothetical protein